MNVPSSAWHIVTITLYSVGMVSMAVQQGWPLPITLFMLIGVPLMWLLYTTRLAVGRLLSAVGVGAALFVIIDAIGHTSGSWYTIVGSDWRLWGISFETVLFAVLHLLFFLALYEYAFDDARVGRRLPTHLVPIVSLLATLVVAAFYLFSVWLVTFPFLWLIALLTGFILLILLLGRQQSVGGLLTKVGIFSLMVWPLSLLYEYVALAAGVRVFAFSSEYLAMVPLGAYQIPVEELLLLFLWPVLLVIFYEGFIDDGR